MISESFPVADRTVLRKPAAALPFVSIVVPALNEEH
jgi:hypothetical protein